MPSSDRLIAPAALAVLALLGAGPAAAGGEAGTARAAMSLFAENCFSPYLTAEKARRTFALSGTTYDFYDLDPFSTADPSPVTGRPATPGADRRCEIAFAGDYAERAAEVVVAALAAEGIAQEAPLPDQYEAKDETALLAARRLNPRKIAVVEIGTRDGAEGAETFMRVERLVQEQAG